MEGKRTFNEEGMERSESLWIQSQYRDNESEENKTGRDKLKVISPPKWRLSEEVWPVFL